MGTCAFGYLDYLGLSGSKSSKSEDEVVDCLLKCLGYVGDSWIEKRGFKIGVDGGGKETKKPMKINNYQEPAGEGNVSRFL